MRYKFWLYKKKEICKGTNITYGCDLQDLTSLHFCNTLHMMVAKICSDNELSLRDLP